MVNVLAYISECRRVLHVASRPRRKEFEQIVKVTGLGMVAIGLIGVILSLILNSV